MIYGLDHLGLARYERGLVAREHPQGWALGTFGTGVFGDSRREVVSVLDTGRVPLFRLQALWSDDDHRFTDDHLRQLESELRKWRSIFAQYHGKIAMCVSPFCEHLQTERFVLRGLEVVKSVLPSAHFVNSPIKRGAIVKHADIINEVHNTGAKDPGGRFFFSYDGTNSVDSDVAADRQRLARAEVFFLWNSQCNGRLTTQDKTPRPKRKAFPTPRHIDSWIAQARTRGNVSLPKGWIYKSHADQHQVPPEARAGKPVWIAPVKASEVLLTTANGQVVDRAKYFSPFSGGGFRYYGGDWGYLIADKARRIQGHELCNVLVNGKKVGVINPIFRAGSFR